MEVKYVKCSKEQCETRTSNPGGICTVCLNRAEASAKGAATRKLLQTTPKQYIYIYDMGVFNHE